jgi:hypothetical protein
VPFQVAFVGKRCTATLAPEFLMQMHRFKVVCQTTLGLEWFLSNAPRPCTFVDFGTVEGFSLRDYFQNTVAAHFSWADRVAGSRGTMLLIHFHSKRSSASVSTRIYPSSGSYVGRGRAEIA